MIKENLSTILLLIVILSVVGIDLFLKKKNSSSKDIIKKTKESENPLVYLPKKLIYLIIPLLIIAIGFYEYRTINNLKIDLKISVEEFQENLRFFDETTLNPIYSKISIIINTLDNKWFVLNDYAEYKARFLVLGNYFKNKTVMPLIINDTDNIISSVCKLNQNKIDSLNIFKKNAELINSLYGGLGYYNSKNLDKKIIVIELLELLYINNGCDKDFDLKKIESSELKTKFLNDRDNFLIKYDDEEFIKIVEIISEPTLENILDFIGIKSMVTDFKNCNEQNSVLKKGKTKYTDKEREITACNMLIQNLGYLNTEEIKKFELLYKSLVENTYFDKASTKTEASKILLKLLNLMVEYGSYNENIPTNILKEYFQNLDYLISGKIIIEDRYRNLNLKSKNNFKNIVRNKVFFNEDFSQENKSTILLSFIEAANYDKDYKSLIEGHKILKELLNDEMLNDKTYYNISRSFGMIAEFQFNNNDYLNAIDNLSDAIKYLEKTNLDLMGNDKAYYLRNLFSAKWNKFPIGDKMGACDDLRNAVNLDSNYYDEYLRFCNN